MSPFGQDGFAILPAHKVLEAMAMATALATTERQDMGVPGDHEHDV